MRKLWLAAWVSVGCGGEGPTGLDWRGRPDPVGEVPGDEAEFIGPGEWLANASADDPVDVSLITSGLMSGRSVRANGTGDHVVFTLAGAACEVDATDGEMDFDVAVEGTKSSVDLEDVGPDNRVLASSASLYEVTPATMGVEMLDEGPIIAARYVGATAVAVTAGCEVRWTADDRVVGLPDTTCDAFDLAVTDSALVVSGPGGTLLVDPEGITVADPSASEQVAVVDGGLFVSSGSTVRSLADGWSYDAAPGAVVSNLVAADGLGVLLVDVGDDEGQQIELLDAGTGEWLGTLDVRDTTAAVHVSRAGGLLLQVRRSDVVSWRITR